MARSLVVLLPYKCAGIVEVLGRLAGKDAAMARRWLGPGPGGNA